MLHAVEVGVCFWRAKRYAANRETDLFMQSGTDPVDFAENQRVPTSRSRDLVRAWTVGGLV